MLNETTFHRQLDILAPDDAKKGITIIGTGAVGTVTALCLAKMGCSNIKVFDFDRVEAHNLPSQIFTPEQIGLTKVEAIKDIVKDHTEIVLETVSKKWDEETVSPIMILAVDSMETRKNIYNKLKEKYMVELMIESRMGAENMRIYPLMPSDPKQQEFYEKTLYSDEEASDEVCTNKAIAYNTFVIGGLIASMVKKHLKKEKVPKELIFNLKDYALLRL